MDLSRSPAKVILLAVEYAKQADVDSLYELLLRHDTVLETDLALRIILTFLPETTPPHTYTALLHVLGDEKAREAPSYKTLPGVAAVNDVSDDQAIRRVRKLRLRKVTGSEPQLFEGCDLLTAFLLQRAYALDEEAGMLNYVAELLRPFVNHSPVIRTLLASTVVPLCRRNIEHHSEGAVATLRDFQGLSDLAAVQYLLPQTDTAGSELVGRDLRQILAPWLYNSLKWTSHNGTGDSSWHCPGWAAFCEWLVTQSVKSWKLAAAAVEQWDGPRDVDFGTEASPTLDDSQLQYLDKSYVRAILACASSITEPTLDALSASWGMLSKARSLLGIGALADVKKVADSLPTSLSLSAEVSSVPKASSSLLWKDLLNHQNALTQPSEIAINFLQMATLTAYLLTRLGIRLTVRRAAELILRRDAREQKSELVKLIRLAANHAPNNDDEYWVRTRNEVLWLHNPTAEAERVLESHGQGAFGMISRHGIEAEFLKAMLSQSRFTLARTLYDDSNESWLPLEMIHEATFHAALDAFDNASNPNRTKGGLRRCNDIIHALPHSVPRTLPLSRQIEALLSTAHSLNAYRLVLKQGEPFSPIVLRVHSDPIAIIQKVLEQNRGAYTRLQEFLEMGVNMVVASFLHKNKSTQAQATQKEQDAAMAEAESRITSMCISAALKEDDFETAYSYVVSRLGGTGQVAADPRSWKAALEAGEYIRSGRTPLPTHLGTSSGNPEVRHLEQRLECLATALRIAPAFELQGILESFRRCEVQLDSAIGDEAAKEAAWDMAGDTSKLPGSFESLSRDGAYPPRNATATAAARHAEESPMSLFDLSRATARVASRNLTSLSSLHELARSGLQAEDTSTPDSEDQQRVRKRDQLREAATGTLVSGVGWLIGANVNRNERGAN